jgi:hypothetical protein
MGVRKILEARADTAAMSATSRAKGRIDRPAVFPYVFAPSFSNHHKEAAPDDESRADSHARNRAGCRHLNASGAARERTQQTNRAEDASVTLAGRKIRIDKNTGKLRDLSPDATC